MITVAVKDFYNLTTLSHNNDEGWIKVYNKIKELAPNGEDIQVSFLHIDLVEPLKSRVFNEMIATPNIFFKIYNNTDLADSIRIMCILNNYRCDRVELVIAKKETKLTAHEQRLIKEGRTVKGRIKKIDGKEGIYEYRICDILKEINDHFSITFIEKACEFIQTEDDPNMRELRLVCSNVRMAEMVVKELASLTVRLELKKNIELKAVDLADKYSSKYLLYLYKIRTKEISTEDKLKIIRSRLKPGTPGMLARYEKSRSLDDFGRSGHGTVVSCRPAIFRHLAKNTSGEVFLVFEEYPIGSFRTREDMLSDCGILGETHLQKIITSAKISEMGLWDEYLGSRYHFTKAVQTNPAHNTKMWYLSSDGMSHERTYTVPERMKAVWDDHGVKYDTEEIEECIKLTNEALGQI